MGDTKATPGRPYCEHYLFMEGTQNIRRIQSGHQRKKDQAKGREEVKGGFSYTREGGTSGSRDN
jgi:hypothetical protein